MCVSHHLSVCLSVSWHLSYLSVCLSVCMCQLMAHLPARAEGSSWHLSYLCLSVCVSHGTCCICLFVCLCVSVSWWHTYQLVLKAAHGTCCTAPVFMATVCVHSTDWWWELIHQSFSLWWTRTIMSVFLTIFTQKSVTVPSGTVWQQKNRISPTFIEIFFAISASLPILVCCSRGLLFRRSTLPNIRYPNPNLNSASSE